MHNIFQIQGTSFFSCLADTTRLALSCLTLLSYGWPKLNHSHACLWLLATLVVVGLHNVLAECYKCGKSELDILIETLWYVEFIKKNGSKQDPARQEKICTKTRSCPLVLKITVMIHSDLNILVCLSIMCSNITNGDITSNQVDHCHAQNIHVQIKHVKHSCFGNKCYISTQCVCYSNCFTNR